MPRYSGRKPYHGELFSRQVGEIRNILHALEMRDDLDESENRPRMDMYENEREVVLEFDLPGFCPEDISLMLKGVTLVLEAHKPREQSPGSFICMERRFGKFHYAVQVPCSVDACSIRAEYRLGVLKVICTKTDGLEITIKEITT